MTKPLLSILSLVVLASTALAMAAALDFDPALRDADLVARIKVVSVAPAPADSGYKHIARATVIDAAKGPKLGESVELLSDNGLICPNILYAVGDDCIVFAKRLKSGHFDTMNAYAGQFRVANGSTEFYPLRRLKTPAEEIMTELRRRLSSTTK